MISKVLFPVMATAAMLAGAPALGATPFALDAATQSVSTRVFVGDIDFARPDAADRLLKRVTAAADRVCRAANPDFEGLIVPAMFPGALRDCRNDTVAAARPQLDNLIRRGRVEVSWLSLKLFQP